MPDARGFAAELLAHYPATFVTEAHIAALASDLQREGLDIAPDVIALLALRCRTVPTGADIHDTAREVRQETMSPRIDIGYDRPAGRWLTSDEIHHGLFHLRRFLIDRSNEDREPMREPWKCVCGEWRTPIPHPVDCSCRPRKAWG